MTDAPEPEKTTKPKKKRGFVRRWGKRLAILLVLAVPLYLVVGFYVLPAAIVYFGLPVASQFVDGRIELDDLDLDPISFTATLRGLRVYDRDDAKVVELGRARAGISRRSLWLDDALVVDLVDVDAPYANLVLREDGTLNLADVFVIPEDDEPPSTEALDLTWLPRIRLEGVQVARGVFKFEDRLNAGARPRRVTLKNLTVGTIDTGSTAATPFDAELASDLGERATVKGSLTLDPLKCRGEAEAAGLRLDTYQPYVGRFVPLTLKSGQAEATLAWELDLTPQARVARAEVRRLAVTGFRLEETTGRSRAGADGVPRSLVGFERLALEGLAADALSHRAELGAFSLDGADLTVEREADGTLPLVKAINETVRRVNLLAAGAAGAAEPEAPASPMPILPPPFDAAVDGLLSLLEDVTSAEVPWTARLDRAEVRRARARWSDAVPAGGAVLAVDPVDASAGPFDTATPGEIPFKATLRVAGASAETRAATPEKGGAREAAAAAAADRGAGEAARKIRAQIAEESLAAADADLGRGLITAQGTLDPNDPMASVLVVVRGLDLTGINPYLPDVVPGLKILSSSIDLRVSPRIRPTKGPLPVSLEDALIRVGGGLIAEYGPPGTAPLTIPVEGLALEYGPLNTKQPLAGNVKFSAVVAGGEVGLVGTAVPRPLRPLESDLAAEVAVNGLELAPLSPLMAPALGRAIDSGSLFMAMPVTMGEGRFKAVVPIAIERFGLGGKVDATGADTGGGGGTLGVPIDLVVAVLKGVDGTLVLPPIPLDFNLLDNKLNLGKAISGAFVGVLRGIATQPLKILGGVAMGGGAAVGQMAGGIKDAAGNVTGMAGDIGSGASDVAGAAAGAAGRLTGAAGDAAGGLFKGVGRGVGGLLGMGGDDADPEADDDASPDGAVAVTGGEAGEAAAKAGIVQAVRFQAGASVLEPGATDALDKLSETLKARGLGLALTPLVDPAVDGPALLQRRAGMAAGGMPAAAVPGAEASARMLRNLALRRARTVRMYLLHAADADLRLPENAILLRPDAAASAADPAAAWEPGPPGVRFDVIAPG